MLHLKASRISPLISKLFQVSPERFLPYLNIHKGEKILDFGCGIGLTSRFFSPESYLGTDVDSQQISYAQKINPSYRFQKYESTLPWKDEEFDRVLALGVFHHISDTDIETVLIEINRVLKPSTFVIAGTLSVRLNSAKFLDEEIGQGKIH